MKKISIISVLLLFPSIIHSDHGMPKKQLPMSRIHFKRKKSVNFKNQEVVFFEQILAAHQLHRLDFFNVVEGAELRPALNVAEALLQEIGLQQKGLEWVELGNNE